MISPDIDFDSLTFFTYYSIGRAKITASLYSNNQDYPLDGVVFKDLQTHIPKSHIFGMIGVYGLVFNNTLLKIKVKAQTNLKMTMEYSSTCKDVFRLEMDQSQGCSLPKG